MTGDPLLACENITVHFGGLTALQGVSVEVFAEEIVGIIGPNGAGKSTLFNVVSGFVPAEGSVTLFGSSADRMKPAARTQTGMARTFQHGRLCEGMPVWENLLLGAYRTIPGGAFASALHFPSSVAGERRAAGRALELAHKWNFADALHENPRDLPFGVQRRVEVARALMHHPRLLLLDEPASGLDSEESSDFAREVAKLPAEEGVGILVIEHDMEVVQQVCERLYVLDFGILVFQGSTGEALADPNVHEAYLGEGIVSASDSRPRGRVRKDPSTVGHKPAV